MHFGYDSSWTLCTLISCSLIRPIFCLQPMFSMKHWWIIAAPIWCQNFPASGHCRGATASASLCAGGEILSEIHWAGNHTPRGLTNGSWKWLGSPSSESPFPVADFPGYMWKTSWGCNCVTILWICKNVWSNNVHNSQKKSQILWGRWNRDCPRLHRVFSLLFIWPITLSPGHHLASVKPVARWNWLWKKRPRRRDSKHPTDLTWHVRFFFGSRFWDEPTRSRGPVFFREDFDFDIFEWPSSEWSGPKSRRATAGVLISCTFLDSVKWRWRVYTRGCLVETFKLCSWNWSDVVIPVFCLNLDNFDQTTMQLESRIR